MRGCRAIGLVEWLLLPILMFSGMLFVYFFSMCVQRLYRRQRMAQDQDPEELARDLRNVQRRLDVESWVDQMPSVTLSSKRLTLMTQAGKHVISQLAIMPQFASLKDPARSCGEPIDKGLEQEGGGSMPWELAGSSRDAGDGGKEGDSGYDEALSGSSGRGLANISEIPLTSDARCGTLQGARQEASTRKLPGRTEDEQREIPVESQALAYDLAKEQAPAQAPVQAPGQSPTQAPAQASAQSPASASVQVPATPEDGSSNMLQRKQWQEETCVICLEEWVEDVRVKQLPCGHHLHRECLVEWAASQAGQTRVCPTCKQPMFN